MHESTNVMVWGSNTNNMLSPTSNKLINLPQQYTLPHPVSQISASQKHVSFIAHGQVYSFGCNLDGRLGVANSYPSHYKNTIQNPLRVQLPTLAKEIECGFSHVCVIGEDGEVYAWGLGEYGALGIGQFKSRNTPTRMLIRHGVVDIGCGAMHTGLVMGNGQVYLCGSNEYGQLGINKPEKISTPILLNVQYPVQMIACGVFYTLMLTATGQVYGMGNNKYGQLGMGHRNNQTAPTLVPNLAGIVQISAGYHSAAIDHYGTLYLWGSGSLGQILRPRKYILGTSIRSISVRGFFGIALGEDTVYTWGNNTYGELGNGTYEATKEPIELHSLKGYKMGPFACGVNFTILTILPPKLKQPQSNQQRRFSNQSNNLRRNYLYSRQQRLYSRQKSPGMFLTHSDLSRREDTSYKYKNIPTSTNYQELFNHLSMDYEKLLHKYRVIEGQLSADRIRSTSPNRQLQSYPSIFKGQANQLAQELEIMREQLRLTLIKLGELERQRDILKIKLSKEEADIKSNKAIEAEYDTLLKKKQQLIITLNLNSDRQKKEYQEIIRSLKQQINQINRAKQIKKKQYQEAIRNLKDQNLQTKQFKKQYQQLIKNLKQENINGKQIINSLKQQINYIKQVNNNWQQKNKIQFEKIQMEKMKQTKLKYDRQIFQIQSKMQNQINQLAKSLQNQKIYNNQVGKEKQQLIKIISEKDIQINQHLQMQLKKQSYDIINKSNQNNDLNLRISLLLQENNSLKIQNKFLKDQIHKYQVDLKIAEQIRQKLQYQIDTQIQMGKDERLRTDRFKQEIEKYREAKTQLSNKIMQIEELNDTFERYKKKMETIVQGQDNVIKDLKNNVEQKQNQIESINQSKKQQLKAVLDKKKVTEKDLLSIKEDLELNIQKNRLNQKQINQLNQQYKSLHRKYLSRGQEVDKQRDQKQSLIDQINEVKKQLTKLKFQKGQTQRLKQQAYHAKEKIQQQLQYLKVQLKELKQKSQNLQNQNNLIKKQHKQMKNNYEQQNRVNQQLIKANKEFADNESQFTDKISELQAKVYNLECENKSYTPRYQALMLRNKQLDERNRQLSDMVNKAIEIQATAYKNNILKDVQIDTNQIISQVSEQQNYVRRNRRIQKKQQSKVQQKRQIPQIESVVVEKKQEPYDKFASEKISSHRKKVSESAQKLARILEIQGKEKDIRQKSLGKDSFKMADYQRINSKMDSLQNQKDQFMNKISSFAQKLKIL